MKGADVGECGRCGLPMAPDRATWWADDGPVATYCRCVHPVPVAIAPRDWRERERRAAAWSALATPSDQP